MTTASKALFLDMDCTCIRTWILPRWLSPAQVVDLCSLKVVGWYREVYLRVNGLASFRTRVVQVEANTPGLLASTQTR